MPPRRSSSSWTGWRPGWRRRPSAWWRRAARRARARGARRRARPSGRPPGAAANLRVGNVFHAGDGTLHPNILYDPRRPGEEARVVQAGAEILKVCAEVGGSISGEHGIGLEKMDYMPFIFSPADLAT